MQLKNSRLFDARDCFIKDAFIRMPSPVKIISIDYAPFIRLLNFLIYVSRRREGFALKWSRGVSCLGEYLSLTHDFRSGA